MEAAVLADLSTIEIAFWIAACGLFVFLSGLFSGAETGLYCVHRMRLRLVAHEGDPSARLLERLFTDQPGLLFTTLLGTNASNYLAPVCLTVIFLGLIPAGASESMLEAAEDRAELWITLILTPVVFIFGEVFPKDLFRRQADRLMPRVARALAVTYAIARYAGLIHLQRWFSQWVVNRFHRVPPVGAALQPRYELYQMLREGAAEGALTRTQAMILERVHRLNEVKLGMVLVPVSRVVMLPADARRDALADRLHETVHSRLPVFDEGQRRVIGVVHVLDLLTAPPDARVRDLMLPPIEFTRDMSVTEALAVLQEAHRRMGIVVDGQGRCIGVVTVKDLVEEIVGELAAW